MQPNCNFVIEFEHVFSTMSYQSLVINNLEKRLEQTRTRNKLFEQMIKKKEECISNLQIEANTLKDQV